ncbi:hypothetical protein BD626DRAFT_477377 [Schizophyllum amplum]|uniref:Copper transporter n=1 Tax=Schizophyllum amplum TaxID=97359 RepID=A0A550D043_9AGAR|nr:hypothetical protein BD626DRAFT_477377 [Auriculariopsis ampla]
MKLSILSTLVAGAALLQQAGASPIRVVVFSNGPADVASHIRIGKPAADHGAMPDLAVMRSEVPRARPCHGRGRGRFNDKAIEISNVFRQALGMPLIEASSEQHRPLDHPHHHMRPDGPMPVMTMMHGEEVSAVPPAHHEHHHHWVHFHHHDRESFLRRVHFALMTLGPWEGRAVAFVLGCGIGVLLRMLWVLAVVSYRTVRGGSDEAEYQIVCEQMDDAENIVVPPPNYTLSDEKVDYDAKVAPEESK